MVLASNLAFAIGLGVLLVESQPGEPLRARVPLLDLGDVRPTELQVELASIADYRQADVNRYEILSNIRLHIESGADGAWLVLTTDQPVPESSSTVILDTSWPGGRILSQHLLTIGGAPAPDFFPVAPVSEPAAADGELADAGRQTIRTVSGDSLWRIAERLAGEDSIYLNQTLLALHRLNPEAFIDGDINRLRADAELRVPELAELGALDQSVAQDESARQAAAADTQPQPLAAPAPQSASQDDIANGQLSLVADDADEDGQGGGDELDRRLANLENQLALALEEVDRVRIEQEELRSRLADLDEQISMARQIITLQQRELAELQAALAAEAEQQARLEEEQASAAAAAQTPAVSDFPDSVIENPVYLALGAAILVLALVAVLLLRRGRREQEDVENETFAVIGGEQDAIDQAAAGADEADIGEVGAVEEIADKAMADFEEEFADEAGLESAEETSEQSLEEPVAEAAKEFESGEVAAGVETEDRQATATAGWDGSEDKAASAAEDAREDQAEAKAEERVGVADADALDEEDDFIIELDEAGEEEVAEQLNLAYSFHKMGETEKARKILENVIRSGNEAQISEARQLLAIIDDLS